MAHDDSIDESKRTFLKTATATVGGIGVAAATIPFIKAWEPPADAVAAGKPIKVDLSKLTPGQQLTVAWRGKPIWIIRRTQEDLDSLKLDHDLLRDPDSKVDQQPKYAQNEHRSINPEYLVLVGLCTHLGCSPTYRPDPNSVEANWPGGFYCSCHGSKFDLAGRVFKGVPAPINLEVPPYTFVSKHEILIGADKKPEDAA